VEVVAQDVGMDTAQASSKIVALAGSEKVRAVIGPLFSAPFSSASEAANALHLPIISPTASSDRLAAVGPFVFQANPDNETRGRAAARYAVNDLRMSSFVIMASDDPVGRSHAGAFAAEARELGATVYASVFFSPGASDLRREFQALRNAVMADGSLISREDLARPDVAEFLRSTGADSLPAFRDTLVDSLSVTALFGARGYAVAESLGLAFLAEDTTAAQLDVPMVTADGIYIALGDPEQLDYVAPQLEYFNIRAQVIGNNEWYDPDRLMENRAALDGAIFLSDFDEGRSDSAMTGFRAGFTRRHGKGPTKFTLYGYDTMRLLLEQVREGARSRLEIASRLAAVWDYPGLHAPISLRDGRVNRHLHVLQFSGGEIRRIGTASGGEL
jgi:ABC-type branched-subunit amino acid transport system substrate-binding protein